MPRGFGDARGPFQVEMTQQEQKRIMIRHPGDRTIVLVLKWPDLARNQARVPQNTLDSKLGGVGAQYEMESS